MRKLFWVVLSGSLGSFAGCNESINTNERAVAIDVVGEPADPTTESMGKADIMGSAPSLPDDLDSDTELAAEPLVPKSLPDDPEDSMDGTDEPDVNGGNGIAKPVSLKTKRTGPNLSK